jgi:3-oxoacyl-[acyl-carrier-protein] synthase III
MQANQRIIDAAATQLQIPSERVISNLANYGNTSVASIPLALDEAVRSGKVKVGQTIAAVASFTSAFHMQTEEIFKCKCKCSFLYNPIS